MGCRLLQPVRMLDCSLKFVLGVRDLEFWRLAILRILTSYCSLGNMMTDNNLKLYIDITKEL